MWQHPYNNCGKISACLWRKAFAPQHYLQCKWHSSTWMLPGCWLLKNCNSEFQTLYMHLQNQTTVKGGSAKLQKGWWTQTTTKAMHIIATAPPLQPHGVVAIRSFMIWFENCICHWSILFEKTFNTYSKMGKVYHFQKKNDTIISKWWPK